MSLRRRPRPAVGGRSAAALPHWRPHIDLPLRLTCAPKLQKGCYTPSKNQLTQELSQVRQYSLRASNRGDVREVAKLTVEAARLNGALTEVSIKEELAER
jgi:hypothetical protein